MQPRSISGEELRRPAGRIRRDQHLNARVSQAHLEEVVVRPLGREVNAVRQRRTLFIQFQPKFGEQHVTGVIPGGGNNRDVVDLNEHVIPPAHCTIRPRRPRGQWPTATSCGAVSGSSLAGTVGNAASVCGFVMARANSEPSSKIEALTNIQNRNPSAVPKPA